MENEMEMQNHAAQAEQDEQPPEVAESESAAIIPPDQVDMMEVNGDEVLVISQNGDVIKLSMDQARATYEVTDSEFIAKHTHGGQNANENSTQSAEFTDVDASTVQLETETYQVDATVGDSLEGVFTGHSQGALTEEREKQIRAEKQENAAAPDHNDQAVEQTESSAKKFSAHDLEMLSDKLLNANTSAEVDALLAGLPPEIKTGVAEMITAGDMQRLQEAQTPREFLDTLGRNNTEYQQLMSSPDGEQIAQALEAFAQGDSDQLAAIFGIDKNQVERMGTRLQDIKNMDNPLAQIITLAVELPRLLQALGPLSNLPIMLAMGRFTGVMGNVFMGRFGGQLFYGMSAGPSQPTGQKMM